jgi:general stress protein 26
MSSGETLEMLRLKRMIEHIDIGMLTTRDPRGALHSRPMLTRGFDSDGVLWFFTYENAHKVDEVARNHEVNISYARPEEHVYISVSGTADLVVDRAKMTELWDDALRPWFPAGLDEPDLALLKVKIQHAELWDNLHAGVPESMTAITG